MSEAEKQSADRCLILAESVQKVYSSCPVLPGNFLPVNARCPEKEENPQMVVSGIRKAA